MVAPRGDRHEYALAAANGVQDRFSKACGETRLLGDRRGGGRRGDYAGAAPTATAICCQVGSQG
jgi:hypothetical protein